MEVPLTCDMLVDQGRFIGVDPVGYKCGRPAAAGSGGALLCRECTRMLVLEPERLTVPPLYGREYQQRLAEESVRKLIELQRAAARPV